MRSRTDLHPCTLQETEDIELDPPTCLLGVSALLQDTAKGRYYVVEVGEIVVACCAITFEWSDW